jgi:hemoglobin
MNAASSEMSLFDRVGGAGGVATLVRDFYARVLADPTLRPYFDGTAMDKLQRMQFEFFSAALGGPVYYTGRPVIHAHQGRGITRQHFQAFVEHLFDTLKDYSLSEQDRYTIIARINTYADDVISRGVGMDT